jgi:hypothetical protein
MECSQEWNHMPLMRRYRSYLHDPHSRQIKLCSIQIRFLWLALMSFALTGCKAKPSWTQTLQSPDGKMVAHAETYRGEPGGGWTQTTVSLNFATGPQRPMYILVFSDGPNTPHGMDANLKWLDAKHLEITYRGERALDLEAVKCEGVSIYSHSI